MTSSSAVWPRLCAPFQRARILPVILALVPSCATRTLAQALDFTAVDARVDFSTKLRTWDGFGFNYVETAQTRDYTADPQEYGGFALLGAEDRAKIVDLVFGEGGLKVGLVKMFLDPFHQTAPGVPFDHETTTRRMREFVRAGLKVTRARGADLAIITTLYGPPAWATKQKVLRGRDLDPEHTMDLVRYLIDWVRFLRDREGLPVKWLSLHNEGEDWHRWTREGLTDRAGHDYNLFWPPEQVARFVPLVARALQEAGMDDVGVTPGETSNWYRFSAWGYATALADDPSALRHLGLITSHGFYNGQYGRWFGDHQSVGVDLLREKRPDLRAWVTSASWGTMDVKNVREHHGNIYSAKVNAIIPWAGIQRPGKWVGGDPNPGCAFRAKDDGTFEITRGYHFYKQLTCAGQPGMAVAHTSAMDSEIAVLAFASNGTTHPDAIVIANLGKPKKLRLRITGSAAQRFTAFRTTEDEKERHAAIGTFPVADDNLVYEAPPGSATTFLGEL